MKISVIIPTLNAAPHLPGLIESLGSQTVKPLEVIIIDSESSDATPRLAKEAGFTFLPIRRSEFNHGATRNLAAGCAKGDYLVFLTQDALPMDGLLLENLVRPLREDTMTAVSYGRQVAYEGAREIEKFVREFNYPAQSRRKGRDDIALLGIKTFFCSNACAAYRTDIFRELGGFRADTIMNEDMEYVYRAVRKGYFSHYAADAAVRHSHDYTIAQQFRRYVDIGVFFSCNQEIVQYARNENEGVRYLMKAMARLREKKVYVEMPRLFFDGLARLAGYRIGLHSAGIPGYLMKRISMNTGYWDALGAAGPVKGS